MKNLTSFLFIFFISLSAFAQGPVIQWQKSLGGSLADFPGIIQQTSDGGYVLAATSVSNDGDVSGHHGTSATQDVWVVKINDTGAVQWQKSLGGTDGDFPRSIQQTTDGGYVVVAGSGSTDGDVTGNHGSNDCWVIKLNDTGGIQWQRSLGGSFMDDGKAIRQTSDGGYIVAAQSNSTDGQVSGNHGGFDCWIVKLNDTGGIQWQKSFGGSGTEAPYSILQTADGGYFFAGYSTSNDGQVTGNHGSWDYWVVKLDDTGRLQWQRSFGGSNTDIAYSVQQTFGGEYILCGSSGSNDGDVTINHGGTDYWVLKLNDTGAILWQRSLGGTTTDGASSIRQTVDSGYIITGQSLSNDVDVSGNHGGADYWSVKLDDIGAIQWQKSIGGSGTDNATCIQQILDGGYILIGGSNSNDYDVSGNHGDVDVWVVKLSCGISAGAITGPPTVCLGSTTTLIDTTSGGVWSTGGSHTNVSAGTVVGLSIGIDTIYYTVTNSCGSAVTSTPITVISCPTGISTRVDDFINIIPNPTTGNISITGANNTTIKVYNIIGQLVASANNTDNISIAAFPAGIYFVRVLNAQGELLKQEKIIKE